MNLTFKRPLIPCDLAGRFCPTMEPCTICAEYFNDLPWWKRALMVLKLRWKTRDLKAGRDVWYK